MSAPATASAVVSAALSQLRIPYAWGAESPGKGFDCSGLVQWAYAQAGIHLPRTSEEQYAATTPVPVGNAKAGDLVFSEMGAQGQSGPGHVGIYLGGGRYIDAPYTGVDVRIDNTPSNAVYGRVTGLTLDAVDTSAVGGAAASGASSATSGSAGGTGCNAGSGGIGVLGIHLGDACQLKALAGGALIGVGSFVFLVGAVLIASYGLTHSSVGRAATRLAPLPVRSAVRVVS
jgi:hypothetical protein